MIIRLMSDKERQEYSWKSYPLNITAKTTKQDIINFIKSKLVKTNETDCGHPVYIDTLSNDIILVTKKGERIFTRYNHIYKGNAIYIELNGSWNSWGRVKGKIDRIIFLDDIIYHPANKGLWSERGFNYSKFYKGGKDILVNELLQVEV